MRLKFLHETENVQIKKLSVPRLRLREANIQREESGPTRGWRREEKSSSNWTPASLGSPLSRAELRKLPAPLSSSSTTNPTSI